MNCRTAQLLLPFADLPDDLGSEERAELDQHLASCPNCAPLARVERIFDDRVGRAIREVTLPAGLREQIVSRLAVERGNLWRRQLVRATAAAAALLLVTIGLAWWVGQKVEVSAVALAQQENQQDGWIVTFDAPAIERQLQEQGLQVKMPSDFDPAYLSGFDIVEFKHRRAVRFDYQHNEARAKVYVLSRRQFKVQGRSGTFVPESHCSVEVVDSTDLIYVIVYLGDAKREQFLNRNQQVG